MAVALCPFAKPDSPLGDHKCCLLVHIGLVVAVGAGGYYLYTQYQQKKKDAKE